MDRGSRATRLCRHQSLAHYMDPGQHGCGRRHRTFLAGHGLGSSTTLAGSQSPSVPPRPGAGEIILHIFPENIAKSVAEGQVLQVVIFSIFFGIALATVGERRRAPVLQFCESLAETMFKFTNLVMLFAPIGVGAAIAYTVSQGGLAVLGNLARLVL